MWAKLSGIQGRKLVLLVAIVLFFAGSAICASATSIARLIAGRAVQGSVAGGLIVLVNICTSDLFDMRFVLISVSCLVRAEYLHSLYQ